MTSDMPDAKSNNEKKTKPTKLERKAFYDDCKRALNKTWQSMSDESSDAEEVDVPSNFKSYTIQDRKIMLQQPKRVKPEQLGESYDGPEDAKKVDLANPGEEPRPIYIATGFNSGRRNSPNCNAKGIQRCICLELQRFEGCRPDNLPAYHTNEG